MMRQLHPAKVLAALVVASGGRPAPATAQAELGARLQEVRQSSAAGDHARALAVADSLARRLPDHPSVIFTRAFALAAAHRRSDAAAEVRRLLRWDPRYARRALEDSTLAPIREELHDVDIEALAARADAPVARARVWAVLQEQDLVPEGTAWDPLTQSVLLGSLNKNKIVALSRAGIARDRVGSGASGLGSVAGIHVDSTSGVLWAASNPRFDDPTDTTTSSLFGFDAATGGFRSRHPAPTRGPHFFNDVTTGPDGTVYLTDSRAGHVWMLRPGAAALAPFSPANGMLAPNGITISGDGRHLFVANGDHVRVFALGSRESWRLATPDSINVTGIDGLAFAHDALIAHHPLAFWRIARYPIDSARRAIVGRELIEHNTADSRTSTTGEVVGNEYVFIGNGQIDRMNARTIDSAGMQPIRMYRVGHGSPGRPGSARPFVAGLVAVALSGRDSVALFDPHTLDRVATLPAGKNPHEIAAAPDGRRAFVANARDTSISVIEIGDAPRVAATWFLPDSIHVHDVAASADGRTVWAASGEPALVVELDAATGRVGRRFPVERPGAWLLETGGPDGTLVIASLEGGAVTILAPTTGHQSVFPGLEGEIDAAPTADGREIWAVNYLNDSLTVFEAATGRILARTLSGRQAARVVFTPDGRTALTVNSGDSAVVAFDVATRQRVASVVVAGGPKVIALSRDGRRAYVTHPERGALTVIDVASLNVLQSVPVPGMPDGVAVLEPPAGSRGASPPR